MGPQTQTATGTRRAPHRQYLPELARPVRVRRHWLRPLHPGEPETCRRALRPFLVNFAHLALLLAVFRVYHLEERPFQGHAFQTIVTLALLAFPAHYLAPYRYKKPLFIAVSIVALFLVCGAATGAFVLLGAALLIAVCRAPVRWGWRAAACAGIGALAMLARPYSSMAGVPDEAWIVLASMFMFRIIVYLYEMKHAEGPEPLVDALGYFFLLPNFCFQLFPVVDYRTMRRGYFAEDVHRLQRRGLGMMFRGALHLLGYRLIYHELLVPAADVHGPGGLASHVVFNYLLYLRVSGQFHMACGMLHLFGHQLPATHHRYLLATSFTDYWRRINIYWKDFMVRIFFNPVVFRLKRWPRPAALALGTAAVFLATWLLHAYQSYWLRGDFGFTGPDAIFWGALGLLVLLNVQLDARKPRPKSRSRAAEEQEGLALGDWAWRAGAAAVRGLKIGATFATVSVLWSLWSSPSLAAWLEMLHRGLYGS